jgi:dipeptidyl aminopeptidase/acylaminoacyl peptidase
MCIRRRMGCVLIIIGLALMTGCRTAEPTATLEPPTGTVTPHVTATSAPPTATQTQIPTVAPTPPEPTATPETPFEDHGGGVITFYSDRDGNPEIYVMNSDGSDQRRLTFSQFEDSSPDVSPDGSQIAFISDRDDPKPGNCFPDCMYQIYLINADGAVSTN